MNKEKAIKKTNKALRTRRTRQTLKGNNKDLPRLSVFRSLRHLNAQIIDDNQGVTLCAVSDKEASKGKPMEKATELGKLLAEKAMAKKINKVKFDRSCYKYHGRVKALAESAREAGLEI